MLLLYFGVAVAVLFYVLLKKHYAYWRKRGVQQEELPEILYGLWAAITRKQSLAEGMASMYNQFPDRRYIGKYNVKLPFLVVRDPELLKRITVKDFDHFTDHRTFVPEESDPYWTKNLFALKGIKWRDMRTNLSPSFTSSKMRTMFVLMEECAENFVQYFVKKEEKFITVEMKDAFTRFTNDVIATSAFGIKVDSLSEPNNEFYLMGKEVTNFGNLTRMLKMLAYIAIPQIKNIIEVEFFAKEVREFFKKIIYETIKMREQKGIVRPDMIHLLMETRKGNQNHEENDIVDTGFSTAQESVKGAANGKTAALTNDDITAQALLFFLAGFETVSTLLCFMTYELALNQDIQERLRNEIKTTLEKCGGKLTYEDLLKMKYMDMVVSEALRKWPAAAILDRVCTKSYTIQPVTEEEQPIEIEKGMNLTIPVFGFHRDPKYYPNPERFDPERFSDENKGYINPYAYFPFGLGPRNCIGSRFALLEAKALIFNFLLSFEMVPVEKTPIPIKFSPSAGNMNVEGGFWLGLKRIT